MVVLFSLLRYASRSEIVSPRSLQQFTYKRGELKEVDEMAKFIGDQFLHREALVKAHSLSYKNSKFYLRYKVKEAITGGVTFVARNRETNNITGVRISELGVRTGEELKQDFGAAANSVEKFFHYADSQFTPGRNEPPFLRNVIVCVSPEIVHQGVASTLNKMVEDFAKEQNCTHLTAMCTSSIPEQLAIKSGYKLYTKIDYFQYSRMFAMDAEWMNRFAKLSQKHGYARIMVKDL